MIPYARQIVKNATVLYIADIVTAVSPVIWGDTCNSQCPIHCIERVCDKISGSCTQGCTQGQYGDTCDNTCSPGCVGGTCDQQSAICSDGCLQNWTGSQCDGKIHNNKKASESDIHAYFCNSHRLKTSMDTFCHITLKSATLDVYKSDKNTYYY